MKVCFKCDKLKPLEEFYKHFGMKDGRLNKCITCNKLDTKNRQEELKLDSDWVEKEKKRQRDKYYRLGYREKHKPTYEQKKKAMDRYQEKYPEKVLARNKTCHLKPKRKGSHLHHWSYNEEHFKDVIELNIKDHNRIHREIIYDQERKMYRRKDTMELLDTREASIEYYLNFVCICF